MDPNISAVEKRFRKMKFDSPPIEVRKYPEKADTNVLTGALLAYFFEYRREIRRKSEIKEMPLLHALLLSEDHFRETPYSLEFWVCGKNGCIICARVSRTVWTPPTEDGALCNYRNFRRAVPPKCSSFRQRGGTNVRKRYLKIGGGGVHAYGGYSYPQIAVDSIS